MTAVPMSKSVKLAGVLNGPFYDTLKLALDPVTCSEIAAALGISAALARRRVTYLRRRHYIEVVTETKPQRLQVTEAGRSVLERGPFDQSQVSEAGLYPQKKSDHFDAVLRLFLETGGPLTAPDLRHPLRVSRSYASGLLAEMETRGLTRRTEARRYLGETRTATQWAIARGGIARLIELADVDWRARVSLVLPEAA
jgi:predicted ArsR family transcriptional regulator